MKRKITKIYLMDKHPALSKKMAGIYLEWLNARGIFYQNQYGIDLIAEFKMMKK